MTANVTTLDYDFTAEQMAALWRAGVTVDDVCRYHATDDCAWHSAEEAFRTLMDRRAEAPVECADADGREVRWCGQRWVESPEAAFHDVELCDPVHEGDEVHWQLYVRGMNVGNVTCRKGVWAGACSNAAFEGDVEAGSAYELMRKVAGQWNIA